MTNETVKLVREITGRHGVTASTAAAREIAQSVEQQTQAYRQFTAGVMAIWAGWTSGRLTEEDAMAAISACHLELQQEIGSS